MRVAVIGAGAVGSATARFLAADGHEVSLIEQFAVDHDRGSSYGPSRIIRKTYADRFYTALMLHAYPLWDALERDSGESLFVRTGGLFFGERDGSEMTMVLEALAEHGVAHDVLDANACARRVPPVRLGEHEIAVLEPDAGFLRASACVRANVRGAIALGATLREHSHVTAIEPSRDHVSLAFAAGRPESFDRVVITAGPWSQRFLGALSLPLTVTRQVYCHLEPSRDVASFAPDRFPVWIDMDSLFYGFPDDGVYPGIKLARHVPGDLTDPDTVDREVHSRDREALVEYAQRRLPALSSRVRFEKVCLYTNTPDEDFIVDAMPDEPRITYVCGLSGHGFKLSVLLGRIAAWRATGASMPMDLTRFARNRFSA